MLGVVDMEKDWTGNQYSAFTVHGATGHGKEPREVNDYYATDPRAMKLLLEQESFNHLIWECACGEGSLSEVLKEKGYVVRSSDLIDRGYGEVKDFLKTKEHWDGDIITNPPYRYASEFVEKALEIIGGGGKVAMFLKLTFLEGKKRKELFKKYPPKTIYVSSGRLGCAKNGEFGSHSNTAIAFAWFVWEKGFAGSPIVKWIN